MAQSKQHVPAESTASEEMVCHFPLLLASLSLTYHFLHLSLLRKSSISNKTVIDPEQTPSKRQIKPTFPVTTN